MPIFIPLMCLLGIGVALFRRSAQAGPAVRDDAPERLLRWAAGLLSAPREEWGQAMLGELGHIDGRGRRWRFAVGCAGAALLLPPWGRAGAAAWAMVTVAAGSAGLYASIVVRYRLGAGDWVFAAIALILLVSYTLVAGVLLRQPGVALPGLLGGLFVALIWLAISGFTFYRVIAPWTWPWAPPVLLIAVPLLLGVAGTLCGGSPVTGRRTAGLAAMSAGLGLYLYATIAVAVLGAGGPPEGSWTVGYIISDRLGNNVIEDLWLLPLTTATIGWAAAAATARIRAYPATNVTMPFTAPVRVGEGTPVRARGCRRTARLLLPGAAVAAILLLAAAGWLRG